MTEDKKTEKRKDSKEVISNGKKTKYEAPSIIELGELARGSGDCVNGSTVIDSCGPGPAVVPGCNEGGTPVAMCSDGGSLND